jgi:hypothetical protein
MSYRRSGKSGIQLPLISLGLWHNFGGVDNFENARAMLRRAFDLGITHFDLRYPSFASLERVIDRLTDQLDPRLEGRVAVDAIRPGDARSMTDELIQAFVTTDVISARLFTFGQLIELQAQELEG